MRISTFDNMISEYDPGSIDQEDIDRRELLLNDFKSSVIFEADFTEFGNALDWIERELGLPDLPNIVYGKLSYDYGFFEVFFSNSEDSRKFEENVPNLYAKFPTGKFMKTNGWDDFIEQQS